MSKRMEWILNAQAKALAIVYVQGVQYFAYIRGVQYFLDEKLMELCEVDNPHNGMRFYVQPRSAMSIVGQTLDRRY